MSAVKGAGLGFLLSALNPKNLIMAVLLAVIGVVMIGKGVASY